MDDYLMLLHPSANRVYGGVVDQLAAAELACTDPTISAEQLGAVSVAGVGYLGFTAAQLGPAVGRHSAAMALFRRTGSGELPSLTPVLLQRPDCFDSDLVTIPKYAGKTNEQFTRLLVNVALSQLQTGTATPTVLDPMCGRGTTLTTAWTLGCHAAGVDSDDNAIEALAAYLKTYLRRKHLKHAVTMSPLRRDGHKLGHRLEAWVRPAAGGDELTLNVVTGDTTQSAQLWGKRRFDAVITDAPYGIVHGARHAGQRRRSPADLLAEAIPVWATQLRTGGVLGLAWNTHGLSRPDLITITTDAGLDVRDHDQWRRFAHRVDAGINRDVLIAVKH